ncbi:unnamed protein product [Enterobius vermicularis]|uniref:Chloride channel protein n=1 Tax=Enterobius vermicularis TaxID=51028 RepID=A0A0N4V3I3_ENTVE|nr:unnamed protein product [Enterobius vermicularis]
MPCLSILMDLCIEGLQILMDLIPKTGDDTMYVTLRFIVWFGYTEFAVMTAAIFTHYVAPEAIGSGVPEMKTVLRGVALKEYLSFRTLTAKLFSLALAIGGGLPVGKEGPFVHIGSMVASLVSRLIRHFKSTSANDSKKGEVLAAGCAAGVACTFIAPIGGVLFSIEVTAVYFAVRDYWRGIFATCFQRPNISLRSQSTFISVTLSAFVPTKFASRTYYPEELFFFSLIGLFCGLTAALFILIHRHVVLFLRRNSIMKFVFQRNYLVYPTVMTAIYSNLLRIFQPVYGRTIQDFFVNCTWHSDPLIFISCDRDLTSRWSADGSIFTNLGVFIVFFFFFDIIASTLPVPAGIFMPAFVLGGAIGRFFGEVIAYNFPEGVRRDQSMLIYPGVYAVVGAASFCGAITHTVSVAVIAFEITGQLVHSLPVMIAVIIANVACSSFQPSFFDSIIKIKHLPYLPDIPKSTSGIHAVRVEQIMVRNVKSVSKKTTYRELQDMLLGMPRLKAFPVVDDPAFLATKLLLGSINRPVLLWMLERKVGDRARSAEALRRAFIKLQGVSVNGDFPEKTKRLSAKEEDFKADLELKNKIFLFQRTVWEQNQLSSCLEFVEDTIDPSPLQFTETTSLYKVHSIFSLLGLRRAYVTNRGSLVGVIALRESKPFLLSQRRIM